MYFTKPEHWFAQGEGDKRNIELVRPADGKRVTYDELLASADPAIEKLINAETFEQRIAKIHAGVEELNTRFGQVNPDVVVMFGDDQSEFFFDDNYPMISLYWGDTIRLLKRRTGESETQKLMSRHWSGLRGEEEDYDYPVESALGLHVIESLAQQDFDVAHMRYQREDYGGSIGPATWYLDMKRTTEPRPHGLPHAFAYPLANWFDGKSPAILPITINTCYPPNWISPRRAYALGQAVRKAVEEWQSDKTVAFAASGGLSHFVVDEEIDRLALKGMAEANGEILSTLPRIRLQSATTEILNWVSVAGAMNKTKMDLLCYEPGYRSAAGTGCGCGAGTWLD
jgi:hypothetical protein